MTLLTPDLGFIFWHGVIMVATLLVLGRFAWKPLLAFIEQREQAHASAIQARKEAEAAVEAVETKKAAIMAQADAARQNMLAEAAKEKAALLKTATQEANQTREKIIDDALQVIAQERADAQASLKKETVALVIHATEKLLATTLSKEQAQVQFIEKMITEAAARTSSNAMSS